MFYYFFCMLLALLYFLTYLHSQYNDRALVHLAHYVSVIQNNLKQRNSHLIGIFIYRQLTIFVLFTYFTYQSFITIHGDSCVLIKIRGERIGCSAHSGLFADTCQGKIYCRYLLTFFPLELQSDSTVDMVTAWSLPEENEE